MYFSVINDVILEYIDTLRDFFQNDPAMTNLRTATNPRGVSADYRWNPDPDLSHIWISDKFPDEDAIMPPFIVINGGGGGSTELDLGQFIGRTYDETTDTHYARYGGIMNMNVDIFISGLTTTERAEIADLAFLCLAHRKREKLIYSHIIPKSSRVTGMSEEPYGNSGKMFMVQVTQNIDVQWYYDSVIGATEFVSGVDVEVIPGM